MTYYLEYMTIYLLIDTLWNLTLMKMILDLSTRVENQVILKFFFFIYLFTHSINDLIITL